jgi:RND family efflux transporter MFP subunit
MLVLEKTVPMRPQIGNFSTAIVLMTSAVMAACGGSSANSAAGPGGRGGSPPAAGVTIVTLQPKPIEQTSDFIATVRSLHSTTIQPQVEGHVTKIFVKSGDQVRAGAPLLQIDPERQAASVRSSEATRQAREADVTYWTGQVERLKSLLNAGAISKNEFDQAQHELEAAQANLGSLNAQVRENQVQLQYYRVIAPTSGTVGDLPIREGDRVTTSTMITTIDDRSALEAYIQIPLDRAPELRVGLPVQFLDKEDRVLVTNGITYVAPRVDDATKTITAKVKGHKVPDKTQQQQ